MSGAMTVEELEHEEPQAQTGPTRHAKIMRGVVTPVFGLIAVACIVLGVLNATIWRPSTDITANAEVSGTRYIVTDPGVLGLVDDRVSLSVDGADDAVSVCVAVGSAKDVTGWVSGNPYVRVTGMSDWTALSTSRAAAQGESLAGEGDVAFADSDMWTSVQCGDGAVSVDVTDEDSSQVALVDLGADDADADVSMHWIRQSVPDFAMPFYFAGGICVVLAVLSATVFAMSPQRRRKRAAVAGAADDAAESAVAETAVEGVEGAGTVGAAAGAAESAVAAARPRRRRRHARHGGGQATPAAESAESASETPDERAGTSSPLIIDPAARNLVADQAAQSGAPAADEPADIFAAAGVTTPGDSPAGTDSADDVAEASTSVISQDELAAYFARFAQESAESTAGDGTKEEE